MALTPAEEQTLIAWIESRQRTGDCPSPREVRDQASHFFKIRTKDERLLGRHWWRGFKLRHAGRIALMSCTSQEPARNAVSCSIVNDYFAGVLDAISRCVSPHQILSMDESGVTARPFKGKTKRVVFLTNCPVAPRFSVIRDVSHVSIVGTISLALKALPPLLHAWHQATYVGCIDVGWRHGAIEVKPPSRGQGIAMVNIREMNEILMQNCPDADDWLGTELSSQ